MNKEELKPVIFDTKTSSNEGSRHSENKYVQDIILKALSEGITDPKELRKIAGLGKVAEVYRSLNKLSMRKEYHDALIMNGIDLGFIVKGLKSLAQTGDEKIQLGSYKTLLKSLGLDEYKETGESGKDWEDCILEASGEDDIPLLEYEVNVPKIPENEKLKMKHERDRGKELYEDKKGSSVA